MASRKGKHTEATTSEEQKKAQVCVVHFKAQLVDHLYTYFANYKGPENKTEKIPNIYANGDVLNMPTRHIQAPKYPKN